MPVRPKTGKTARFCGIGIDRCAFFTSSSGVNNMICAAAYGAATAIFGVSRHYALSLAMLSLLGAADMISVFIRNSLIQLHTPDDKRGRVSSISGLAISASNELGEMESGFAASVVGAPGAVVFGGLAAIAITAIWAWAFPEIRRAASFAVPVDALSGGRAGQKSTSEKEQET